MPLATLACIDSQQFDEILINAIHSKNLRAVLLNMERVCRDLMAGQRCVQVEGLDTV